MYLAISFNVGKESLVTSPWTWIKLSKLNSIVCCWEEFNFILEKSGNLNVFIIFLLISIAFRRFSESNFVLIISLPCRTANLPPTKSGVCPPVSREAILLRNSSAVSLAVTPPMRSPLPAPVTATFPPNTKSPDLAWDALEPRGIVI